MNRFDIEIVLGIVLVISYVGNGFNFRLRYYDRRLLMDAQVNTPTTAAPAMSAPVAGATGASDAPVVAAPANVMPGAPAASAPALPGGFVASVPVLPPTASTSVLPVAPATPTPILPSAPTVLPNAPTIGALAPLLPGAPTAATSTSALPNAPAPVLPSAPTIGALAPVLPGASMATTPVLPSAPMIGALAPVLPGAPMAATPVLPSAPTIGALAPVLPGAPMAATPVLPSTPASILPGGADTSGATIFDISKSPGAKGDGQTDVTVQVNKAWTDSCHSIAPAKILIPPGDWLVGELQFTGPCTTPAPITIEVEGTLKAKPDLQSFPSGTWINVNQANVFMMGGGTLHGQGEATWKAKKPGDKAFPDSLVFHQCPNSGLENVHIVNSKGFNMKLVQSDGFKVNLVNISCGLDSSNTDGIHIGQIKNVSIINTVIGVGDDCISIGDDSTDVTITNITCGPGHGISIGSLGRSPGEKDVRNVAVSNCTFRNTDNGARIKTFHESPVLQASNISFTDINIENVSNPIIIDQNYFAKKPGPSKVKISGVTYKNFRGSSFSIRAILLNCSSEVPCEAISFADIDFTYCGKDTVNRTLKSACENVKPTFAGKMMPPGC